MLKHGFWTARKKLMSQRCSPKWKLVIQLTFSSFIIQKYKKNGLSFNMNDNTDACECTSSKPYEMSNGALLICRATAIVRWKSQAIYELHARIFAVHCVLYIVVTSKHTYTPDLSHAGWWFWNWCKTFCRAKRQIMAILWLFYMLLCSSTLSTLAICRCFADKRWNVRMYAFHGFFSILFEKRKLI